MIEATATFTDHQRTEGRRRREILERFWLLKRQEITVGEAAELVGEAESTLRDWQKHYDRAKDWNDLIPGKSTGRRSAKAKLEAQIGVVETAKVIAEVQACHLQTGTNSGSWRYTAATGDNIPQVVRELILDPTKASKHSIPKSLTTATKVTRAERLAFQGRRALRLNGGYVPRFLDITPGDVFVPDDKTPA